MINPGKMRIWNIAYMAAEKMNEFTKEMPKNDASVRMLSEMSVDTTLTIAFWTFVGLRDDFSARRSKRLMSK